MIILYVRGVDARASAGQERVEVLTATAVIEPGESVKDAMAADKLESREVARDDVGPDAVTSEAALAGLVALGTVYPDNSWSPSSSASRVVSRCWAFRASGWRSASS